MKNLKIWSLALALLMVVTGCEEKTATDNFKAGATNIVGEWQLTEWDGDVAPFDVYINFDGAAVVIYQRIYSAVYEKFDGTYTLNGSKLMGMYNSGTEFGPYRAEVSVDGNVMRLHKTDGEREIMGVYKKTTIPEWVKAEASATRASEAVPFL